MMEIENHIIQLIQAEIDGENSPEDSSRLEEILAENEEARSLYEDLKEMAMQMDEIKKEIELPLELSANIKEEIEKKGKNRDIKEPKTHKVEKEKQVSGTRMFTGSTAAIFAAAAMVIVVVLVTTEFPQPNQREVSGITETEQREVDRGPQITDTETDFKSETIQEILQSSTFQRVVEAGELYALTTNGDFLQLIGKQSFNTLFTNPDFYKLIADSAFNTSITSSDSNRLKASSTLHRLMANPEFNELLENPAFNQLIETSEFKELMVSPEFTQLLKNPDFNELISRPDFSKLMVTPDFYRLIAKPALN